MGCYCDIPLSQAKSYHTASGIMRYLSASFICRQIGGAGTLHLLIFSTCQRRNY